jgi:N-acetylneuraminic acid mutarotase
MPKFVAFTLVVLLILGFFIVVINPVSAELFENTLTVKTSMSPTERIDFGVVAVEGKIYAIGGSSSAGRNERYDTVTDTWVTLESMPTVRVGFAIVAYQGKIYCIGGQSRDGVFSVNEVYDIASDSWSTKASLPVEEFFIQAHVVDGEIIVVTNQALYVYDPVDDSWTNKTGTPTQGVHASSVAVDHEFRT